MLLSNRCTTLTLTPQKQLHPKEMRDRAAQNPKSNPTYTIASFESNPTYTIAPKRDKRESRGNLWVHKDIDSRSGENKIHSTQKSTSTAAQHSGKNNAPLGKKQRTALEKTSHLQRTHAQHSLRTYALHSCTALTHRSLAPHSRTALDKHGIHAPHSPEAQNKFLEVEKT
jgi:hypothetical protein